MLLLRPFSRAPASGRCVARVAAGHAGHASADDDIFLKLPRRWRRRLEAADEDTGRGATEVSRARTHAADACRSLLPRTRARMLTCAPPARVCVQVDRQDRRGAAGRPSGRATERGRGGCGGEVEAEVEGRGGGQGGGGDRGRGGGRGGARWGWSRSEAEAQGVGWEARRRSRGGRRPDRDRSHAQTTGPARPRRRIRHSRQK